MAGQRVGIAFYASCSGYLVTEVIGLRQDVVRLDMDAETVV